VRVRVGMGWFARNPHPPPSLPLEGGGVYGAALSRL
jgi:hypothetical protein